MNPKSVRRPGLVSFCVCLLCVSTGCDVGGVFRHGSGPDGSLGRQERTGDNADFEASLDIKTVEAGEVDLVESVIAHRSMYRQSLEELHTYYGDHGYASKESWAAFELGGLKNVRAFSYLMDAEIPSYELRPRDKIDEADALFKNGLALMKRGGHGVPALYRGDMMVKALGVFRELVQRYPSSDKIDDAAFYCGEISKEYLKGQETIAVKWYQRVWTWDPETRYPARFQAAVVYDYRLHERDRALELYHAVVEHEGEHKSNVRFASRRIHELVSRDETATATKSR